MRIGIEVFGTQTASRLRGIGRYSRDFVAALLTIDPANDYVLYGQDGLPTDQIPTAPNAILRLVRPDPSGDEATMAHAMERVAETNPDGLDALLLLNPLEMGYRYDIPARPFNGLKMAALVHDVIPFIFQEEYFPAWAGTDFLRRYLLGLDRLRGYDALVTNSEATRRDVISLLGVSPDRVVTIGTASDGRFFVPDRSDPMPEASRSLLQSMGIARPFVFSVGALEYRKNVWGLIDAFAMLPDELRTAHQLVLTYALSPDEAERVRGYARDRGVVDELVLTDRLEDADLRVFYQRCAAFVFPSSYEGFGIPILEAMHCGAPVIAGNNSSQIEVVGDAGLLFNVASAGELAGHLLRLLEDPGRARAMGDRAVVQARRFHWETTAERALNVLTGLCAPAASATPRPGRRRAPRPRIAFFSPLPPLLSGIANYSARLLDELKRHYAIDLYHDDGCVPHLGLQSPDFACYDHRLFERNARVMNYHALVYQMGNSPYHGYLYEKLMRHPGIVTLHDLNLGGFHAWYARQPWVDGEAHVRRELEAYCGASSDEALAVLASPADTPGGVLGACIERGYHLNGRIFEQASAVIVHSNWGVEQVRRRFPGHLGKTSVVPHGAKALDPSPERRRAMRARLEMPEDALIIASLGLVHPTKMNAEAIAAFAPLAGANPEALLIFVGDERDGGEARRLAMGLGLQDRVRFLGHYPGDLADVAAIADIGICLRRPPTNGETSGALIDLLRLGVPTIASDVGSFSDYPESVVCKHRMETDGLAGLTRSLRQLAEDRPRREALGRAAWQYIRQYHAWPIAADAYAEIIERTVAGRTRPRSEGIPAPSFARIVASPAWTPSAI